MKEIVPNKNEHKTEVDKIVQLCAVDCGCATDRDSKHLPRVSLATCQLLAFLYARLPINSSASRQVRYLKHIFESICLKPIKKSTSNHYVIVFIRHIHSSTTVIILDTPKLDFYVLLFVLFAVGRTMLIYALCAITTLISSLCLCSVSFFFFFCVQLAYVFLSPRVCIHVLSIVDCQCCSPSGGPHKMNMFSVVDVFCWCCFKMCSAYLSIF